MAVSGAQRGMGRLGFQIDLVFANSSLFSLSHQFGLPVAFFILGLEGSCFHPCPAPHSLLSGSAKLATWPLWLSPWSHTPILLTSLD